VGGQKTLRSYWRNYFEKTDALIWVVDATDRLRVEDCREELHGLLQEEVSCKYFIIPSMILTSLIEAFWGKFACVRQQD
jgi:GTPase SAR1 family protein